MHRKTLLGLFGVLGIWLTAGVALPLVNVLSVFPPSQLMVFRGFLTAAMALIGLRGVVGRVDAVRHHHERPPLRIIRPREGDFTEKCFWACMGMGLLGLILSTGVLWAPITEPRLAALVVGFAFVGGFLYWISNLLAFENLPTTEASVLAQGETPAVILGAGFLLGERVTPIQ